MHQLLAHMGFAMVSLESALADYRLQERHFDDYWTTVRRPSDNFGAAFRGVWRPTSRQLSGKAMLSAIAGPSGDAGATSLEYVVEDEVEDDARRRDDKKREDEGRPTLGAGGALVRQERPWGHAFEHLPRDVEDLLSTRYAGGE